MPNHPTDCNRYLSLYLDIVQHVIHDYALYPQKTAYNNSSLLADRIAFNIMHASLTNTAFVHYVNEFVAAFQDPSLRVLIDRSLPYFSLEGIGVHMRHHEGALHIEKAAPSSSFEVGDRIVGLSSHTVDEIAQTEGLFLYGKEDDRQLWDGLVAFHKNLTVLRADGREERVRPARIADLPAEENSCVILKGDVALLTLHSLEDEQAVTSLVRKHEGALLTARGLIIDGRDCRGTHEEALLPLLPFIADRKTVLGDFLESTLLFRNSKGNRSLLQNFLVASGEKTPVELRWMAKLLQEANDAPEGAMVPFDAGIPARFHEAIAPRSFSPVVLITDVRTSGAAETLAEIGKASNRCTVVGRNTMGSLGTALSAVVPISEFMSFEYPLACFGKNALKRHGHETGIAADIFVPWMPRSKTDDPELARAQKVIRDSNRHNFLA